MMFTVAPPVFVAIKSTTKTIKKRHATELAICWKLTFKNVSFENFKLYFQIILGILCFNFLGSRYEQTSGWNQYKISAIIV